MMYDYGLDYGELGEHFLVLTDHKLDTQIFPLFDDLHKKSMD